MEKIIFFGLVIPILAFVLYLGGNAIMKGMSAKNANKEKENLSKIISMTTKWNDKSWQKEFLNMKSHSPADAKLLMGGLKGLKGTWRLGVLHVEYERLKKIQEQQQ